MRDEVSRSNPAFPAQWILTTYKLSLYSAIQQQKAKALLAMSEKLQVLELEQHLVQAEMARVMHEHRISLVISG
jgi:hypothetical protein